ncbi:MAG: sigma-54-dependent Fis family transcriptional regulator [bacterium]|nr:sigma-54-dependent Fis family transcriptional regulator [bacterium]
MARERILVVDDEKLIRWSVRSRLQQEGYAVEEAADGKHAFELLEHSDCDLLVLDYRLPDTTGIDILEKVRAEHPEISVLMMTAYGTVESAVQAMKLGAFDYLTKPVNLDELSVVVQKALETTRLRREVRRLRTEQRETHGKVRLIGTSSAMQEVLDLIDKICVSQATTVLIEGDSGTGKNVVAKAIHYGSPRADRPFVNITCSALTETLLESELFGHERGAFTDAKTQKKGLLEVSEGGTAFLDEIGEMGPAMQAKLLRFLEEKTFKRVGGTRDIRVEVRIVAATNRNLEQAVREGRFREDLYYRLKVIPIHLPSLRDRRDDVPLLVQHFLDEFNAEFRKNTNGVSREAMEHLTAYDWPGNIRELRNVLERIMILEDKEQIGLEDLPSEIVGNAPQTGENATVGRTRSDVVLPLGTLTLEDLERGAIEQALERTSRNQVKAAKLLGISRDTLRYRMKKFGLLDRSDD